MANFVINQKAAMINLIGNFIIAAYTRTRNSQNEMDSRNPIKSMLTNLFREHKYLGVSWTSFNRLYDLLNIFPISSMATRKSRTKI